MELAMDIPTYRYRAFNFLHIRLFLHNLFCLKFSEYSEILTYERNCIAKLKTATATAIKLVKSNYPVFPNMTFPVCF